MKRLIGSKKFYKEAVFVGAPMILQQFITNSVNFVDNLMVGKLGAEALAAVSVTNQFYFVYMLASMGAIVGAGIYSAQFFGAEDYKHLRMTFSFKLLIAFVFSIVTFVLFYFNRHALINLFVSDQLTHQLTYDYFTITLVNVFSSILVVAISFSFREVAKPKFPFYASIVAVLTNSFLNYVLIFGHFGAPRLEVAGAAYATVIARLVELTLLILFLKSEHGIFYHSIKDLFVFSKKLYKDIIIKMVPLSVNEILWSLGMTVFYYTYSTRGSDTLAGFAISQTINNLAFVLFGGMNGAITVLVGNRLGANKLEDARVNATQLIFFSLIISVTISAVLFIVAPHIVSFYEITDEVRAIAIRAIRTNALFFPVFAYTVGIFFSLRAGGDTRSTMLMDSVYMWVVAVPIAFAVAKLTDVPSTILLLVVVSMDIPKAFVATYFFRKGKWLKNLAMEEANA